MKIIPMQTINYNFTFFINSAIDVPSITINGSEVKIEMKGQTKQISLSQSVATPGTPEGPIDFSKFHRRVERGLDRLATVPVKFKRPVSQETKKITKKYQESGPQRPTNLVGFKEIDVDDLEAMFN